MVRTKACLVLAWLMAGLAITPLYLSSAQVSEYRKAGPGRGHLIAGVPFEKWLGRNLCGPACLAMVFAYWDRDRAISQRAITAEIYDSQSQATYNSELVLYPRAKGFSSYSFQGDLVILKEVVREDIPVIVLTKATKQVGKGHYRVIIGFDEDTGQVIFHDPFFGGRRAMTVKDFMKVWALGKDRNRSRWMMAVVPAGRPFAFPALRDDPLTSINLATAYYRRTDYARSKEQWEKVREALPNDPYPLYSLAMVSIREGNVGEAEAYALQALGRDAKSAYAHDVLGLAYAAQGRIDEALTSLALALRLAPREEFVRSHYLQVRTAYIEAARRNDVHKGEKSNERTS